MSVDVTGCEGDETFFSNAGWAFLLDFAAAYGWNPVGTKAPPERDDWDGHYDPAEGQTILAPDALAFTRAIDEGLQSTDRMQKSTEIANALTALAGFKIAAFKFADKSVEHWKNFIAIAEKGSFVIW